MTLFYRVHRHRQKRDLYVNRSLKFDILNLDSHCVEVKVKGTVIANVYRHQDTPFVPPLFKNKGTCLVVGDFNLRHPEWQKGSRISEQALKLEEWRVENGLRHLVKDVATHQKGGVIDLSMTNAPEAWARVEGRNTGSDHCTVRVVVSCGHSAPKWRRLVVLPKQENLWAEVLTRTLKYLGPVKTVEEVDKWGEDLWNVLKLALVRQGSGLERQRESLGGMKIVKRPKLS